MPLQAPVDYSAAMGPTPDPAAAVASGFALGNAVQQKGLAQQQQQIAFQRQQDQRKDLLELSQKPSPTARDYAAIVTKYPELKDSFKDSWNAVSAEQQQQKLAAAAPVYHALQSGRPDLAEQLLQQNLDALKNSKASDADIRAADTWLKMVQQAPGHAQTLGATFLASVMGPEKFEATFGGVGKENRADLAAPGDRAATAATTVNTLATAGKTTAEIPTVAPKADAEVRNINSQIAERAGNLALNTDKLESETGLKILELTQKAGQLTPDARKVINDSAGASVVASNSAVQMKGLADQFDKLDAYTGGVGAFAEATKSFTGEQNYATQLRKEYTRIRAGQVNSLLPPGPASDKDIQNAQAGFLKDTANPQEIASWLRGVAKLQEYQSQYEDARGQWVAAVGHLGRAPKDLDINGVKVAAGTTLPDFIKKTLKAPGPVTQPPKPAAKTNYLEKYGTARGASGSF